MRKMYHYAVALTLCLLSVALFADAQNQKPLDIQYIQIGDKTPYKSAEEYLHIAKEELELEDESHTQKMRYWLDYLNRPHPDVESVKKMLQSAADEYDVPYDIFLAVALVENNLTHLGPSIDEGWGLFLLNENTQGRLIAQAEILTEIDEDSIKNDPYSNALAAAALLRFNKSVAHTEGESVRAWIPALKRFSGYDHIPGLAEKHVLEYLKIIKNGYSSHTPFGEKIQVEPVKPDLDLSDIEADADRFGKGPFPTPEGTNSADYGPAISNISPCNYTAGRGGNAIDAWVNHWIGVGTYAGAISWFHNCSANVSAHFVVKNDGEITQVVGVANTAWHAGVWSVNQRSIGVEHEATAANPDLWKSSRMVQASADMCRHFADLYGFPKSKGLPGLNGHNDHKSTQCPGTLDWTFYLSALNRNFAPSAGASGLANPVNISWAPIVTTPGDSVNYRIQISTATVGFSEETGFANPIVNEPSGTAPLLSPNYTFNAPQSGDYYWTIRFYISGYGQSSRFYPPMKFNVNTSAVWPLCQNPPCGPVGGLAIPTLIEPKDGALLPASGQRFILENIDSCADVYRLQVAKRFVSYSQTDGFSAGITPTADVPYNSSKNLYPNSFKKDTLNIKLDPGKYSYSQRVGRSSCTHSFYAAPRDITVCPEKLNLSKTGTKAITQGSGFWLKALYHSALKGDPDAQFTWYKNGSPLGGTSADSLWVSATGTYTVRMDYAPCSQLTTPDDLSVQIVSGLAEVVAGDKIKIYPNPADGALFVECADAIGNVVLNVFDATGKQVYSRNFNGGKDGLKTRIDAIDWPKGMYILKLRSERKTPFAPLRFVVE